MIREFQRDDINKVADIWLDTNIKAHNFIPAEYWKSNFKSVKEALLLAEVYVYEYDTEIQGFIGLNDEYVEGIFVSGEMQSQGIGKILLNYAKDKRNKLYLNVYQKNARAISFYKREITCKIAADYLGISPMAVSIGMRNDLLPIGFAIHNEERDRTYSESWSYHIIGERLIAYKYGKTSEVQVQNIEKSLNTIIEQFEEMKKDLVFLLSENEDQQD